LLRGFRHLHVGVEGDAGLLADAIRPVLDHQLARVVAADGSGGVLQMAVAVEECRFDVFSFQRPLGELAPPAVRTQPARL
jgi:hypothetical protein